MPEGSHKDVLHSQTLILQLWPVAHSNALHCTNFISKCTLVIKDLSQHQHAGLEESLAVEVKEVRLTRGQIDFPFH